MHKVKYFCVGDVLISNRDWNFAQIAFIHSLTIITIIILFTFANWNYQSHSEFNLYPLAYKPWVYWGIFTLAKLWALSDQASDLN